MYKAIAVSDFAFSSTYSCIACTCLLQLVLCRAGINHRVSTQTRCIRMICTRTIFLQR